jgi:hypothetical protein
MIARYNILGAIRFSKMRINFIFDDLNILEQALLNDDLNALQGKLFHLPQFVDPLRKRIQINRMIQSLEFDKDLCYLNLNTAIR